MPRYWKILSVAKTPENSTLWAYRLILPAYDTIWGHFRHYRTKIRKLQIKIDGSKIVYVARYALHISHFLVNNHSLHYSKHHLPKLSKYHLLPFTQLFTLYQIFYHILLHQISYSLQLYRYYNTVIAM